MIWGIVVAIFALVADQLSKYYMETDLLEGHSEIIVTSFFSFVRAWNTGVSFSMFNDGGTIGVIVLSTFAALVVLMLLWWMKGEEDQISRIGLGLIIGGAIGNIVDRIMYGAVFDFLDFHIGEYHWPAFNLADSFICIGAIIIVMSGLWKNRKKEVK